MQFAEVLQCRRLSLHNMKIDHNLLWKTAGLSRKIAHSARVQHSWYKAPAVNSPGHFQDCLTELFQGVFGNSLKQWVISSCLDQDLQEGEFNFKVGMNLISAQYWLKNKVIENKAITFTKLLCSPGAAFRYKPLILPAITYCVKGQYKLNETERLKHIDIKELFEAIQCARLTSDLVEEELDAAHKVLQEKSISAPEMFAQLKIGLERVRGDALLESSGKEISNVIPVLMTQYLVSQIYGGDYWLYVPCGVADQYPHFFAVFCLESEPTENGCDMVQRILDSTISNDLIGALTERALRFDPLLAAVKKWGHDVDPTEFNPDKSFPGPLRLERVYGLLRMFDIIHKLGTEKEKEKSKDIKAIEVLVRVFMSVSSHNGYSIVRFWFNEKGELVFEATNKTKKRGPRDFSVDLNRFVRSAESCEKHKKFLQHKTGSNPCAAVNEGYKQRVEAAVQWIELNSGKGKYAVSHLRVPRGLQGIIDPLIANVFTHTRGKPQKPVDVVVGVSKSKITLTNAKEQIRVGGEAKGSGKGLIYAMAAALQLHYLVNVQDGIGKGNYFRVSICHE